MNKRINILSGNYKGKYINIYYNKQQYDEGSFVAAKLLKQKPFVPKALLKSEYAHSVKVGRRSLKDMFSGRTTTLLIGVSVLFKKPKHFKYLNKYAERQYIAKIPTSFEEQFSSRLDGAMFHARVKILSAISSRNRTLGQLRKENRAVEPQNRIRYLRDSSVDVTAIEARTRLEGDYRNSIHFTEPGTILKMAEARRCNRIFKPKKPTTNERHVSVEIEFACKLNQRDLGSALFNAGLDNYVQLKTDGSVRDFPEEYYAHEVAVCMPVSKRDEVLETLLDVVNSNGGRVNKTCGLHVHLDMRSHDHKKAFNNLVAAQVILYKMIPSSRRSNKYCSKTTSKFFDAYRNSSNRYMGINPQSFRKYGTIEIRLHSGTTDFTKIVNFVDIVSAVGYNEAEIVRGASTVKGFVKQHKLSKQIEQYIEHRIRLFGNFSQEEAA